MNQHVSYFKKSHSFEQRRERAMKIRLKYPDKIPVIVEKSQRALTPDLKKTKILVSLDLKFGEFVASLRKRITIGAAEGMYVFCDNHIPPNSVLMSDIYSRYRDKDGFLYVVYSLENTFG